MEGVLNQYVPRLLGSRRKTIDEKLEVVDGWQVPSAKSFGQPINKTRIENTNQDENEIEQQLIKLEDRRERSRKDRSAFLRLRNNLLLEYPDEATLALCKSHMCNLRALFCRKLPREIRDMVYSELLSKRPYNNNYSNDGAPLDFEEQGPISLDEPHQWNADESQIYDECRQTFYRKALFHFQDINIYLLPCFLRRDLGSNSFVAAAMLRHIELSLIFSGYHYLSPPEEGPEGACRTCPPCLDSEGVALTATLPIVLREVNGQCRVVVRFGHPLQLYHRTDIHPNDILTWVHLSQAMKGLLKRGHMAEVYFSGLHLYSDPAMAVPYKVFDQPVQEWAMEQEQLWLDLYHRRQQELANYRMYQFWK